MYKPWSCALCSAAAPHKPRITKDSSELSPTAFYAHNFSLLRSNSRLCYQTVIEADNSISNSVEFCSSWRLSTSCAYWFFLLLIIGSCFQVFNACLISMMTILTVLWMASKFWCYVLPGFGAFSFSYIFLELEMLSIIIACRTIILRNILHMLECCCSHSICCIWLILPVVNHLFLLSGKNILRIDSPCCREGERQKVDFQKN